jgi:hypothetical protein
LIAGRELLADSAPASYAQLLADSVLANCAELDGLVELAVGVFLAIDTHG